MFSIWLDIKVTNVGTTYTPLFFNQIWTNALKYWKREILIIWFVKWLDIGSFARQATRCAKDQLCFVVILQIMISKPIFQTETKIQVWLIFHQSQNQWCIFKIFCCILHFWIDSVILWFICLEISYVSCSTKWEKFLLFANFNKRKIYFILWQIDWKNNWEFKYIQLFMQRIFLIKLMIDKYYNFLVNQKKLQ